MQAIEIEDDIYAYLLSRTTYVGESLSSILRRELIQEKSDAARKDNSGDRKHVFSELLSNPRMRLGSATDRFLAILGEASRQKPKEFQNVLSIQGRNRVYFARSREEIARSGKSTQPLQIPGTQYWVMTNSPTPQKKAMLTQALTLLGYSELSRIEAARVL